MRLSDLRELLSAISQDIRHTMRWLRHARGFSATVVITLGIGIGATTAMFGIVDRLMFRGPPQLRDPAAVNRVYLQTSGSQGYVTSHVFPYARYLDLMRWTTSFSQTAVFHSLLLAIGAGDAAREYPVAAVSASLFGFFDIAPALGRFFTEADDTPPAGGDVVVLSHAFWQAAYGGGNPIGDLLLVGNVPATIVGVAPERFTGIADGPPPAVFVPITAFAHHHGGSDAATYFDSYTWDWTEMIVRRRPGVSAAAASHDLTNAFARSRAVARERHGWAPPVETAPPRAIAGALRTAAGPDPGLEARTLVWLTAVAAIVLLIAVANVANLFLLRALRQYRETSVRLALGVTMRRLLAQSLTETVTLSLAGCVVGVTIAAWAGSALHRLVIADGSPYILWRDARVLSASVAAALLAAAVTGLAPVLLARRSDINAALRSGARLGAHHHARGRRALLVLQGGLSMALLVGAALFLRSIGNVHGLPIGYEPDRVLHVQVYPRGGLIDDNEPAAFRERVLARARMVPGVQAGAWVSSVPFRGATTTRLAVPGIDSVARLGRFDYQAAGADYFTTMGTRILRGRPFNEADRPGAPTVAVVSEGMARRIWRDRDPIGQCIRIGNADQPAETMPCTTVVGVAENALYNPVADRPFRYYLPLEQFPRFGAWQLVLRTTTDPARLVDDVTRALQTTMPGQWYVTASTARSHIDAQRRSWQLGATLFTAFGALAWVVAAVGLYGVISYNVGQRQHEMSVRIALGARRYDVVRVVAGQGLRFASAGVILGAALAFAVSPWIEPLLFRQSPRDPAPFVTAGLLLLVTALVACALPALRASRTDPNVMLRGA
jgi:predicted permease